jgi:hypothetical protein
MNSRYSHPVDAPIPVKKSSGGEPLAVVVGESGVAVSAFEPRDGDEWQRREPYAFAHGHRPDVLHSEPSTVAFAVGDAILVATVVGGGPAVAVAPRVMAGWVGWEKVLTMPLPEPATCWPGSFVAPTISADAITAPLPIAASSFVCISASFPLGGPPICGVCFVMPSETPRIPGSGLVVIDQRRNWSSSTIHTHESTPRYADRNHATADFEGTRSPPPDPSKR